MDITYIFHSCFLVETQTCYYLFDYYRKQLPKLNPQKPILVFASHFHQDHYNKEVFEQLKQQGMTDIHAILSKDISKRDYPEKRGIEITCVTFHQHYELPYETSLETLHSTDSGVAFLVTCPEGVIYYAGDLNDWVWKGEPSRITADDRSYRHEIKMLAEKTIDVAFLPLDPRQEEYYAEGMRYFWKMWM